MIKTARILTVVLLLLVAGAATSCSDNTPEEQEKPTVAEQNAAEKDQEQAERTKQAEPKGGDKVEENQTESQQNENLVREMKKLGLEPGLYTVIDTSMGRIICELFPDAAPKGVDNFVGLAEGTKEFIDPRTGQKTRERYYDGLTFHRVIPDFMIQGGDPLGTGAGGPGYEFENETSSDLKFDRPGRLAYANRGKDTNGSQFFITHRATPHLNGGYTIFGQVVDGQDIVNKIAEVERNHRDMPLEPVYMKRVDIVRIEKDK